MYFEIVDPVFDDAKQLEVSFPPYFSFGYCCDSYSEYRQKFSYLMDYIQNDIEKGLVYVREDIDDANKNLLSWRQYQSPYALERIAYYEDVLLRKTLFLQEELRKLPIMLSLLSNRLNNVATACEQIYTSCIENHHSTDALYERGLIYYDQGKYLESINDISSATENTDEYCKNFDFYLLQTKSFSDVGLYKEAIDSANKALALDPKNKEALLEKAVVLFETGEFDDSIKDFLASGIHSTPLETSHLDFAAGFFAGAMEGLKGFGTEFFPSLLSTARGLGSILWLYASDPLGLQFSEEMYNGCQNLIRFLSSHTLPEIIETISPKLKALIYDADSLSSKQKGEYLGYLIAKNGVEIAATVGATKIYQEIRKANTILTLEALSQPTQKVKVIEKAAEWGEKHSAEIHKIKVDEAYIKTLRNQNLSETAIRKTIHELGYKTFPRPNGIPNDWVVTFSNKKMGMKYIDPMNKHRYVRVMPGNPTSPNPWQHNPYVQDVRDGKYFDKYGSNFALDGSQYTGSEQATHIPLHEFKFTYTTPVKTP